MRKRERERRLQRTRSFHTLHLYFKHNIFLLVNYCVHFLSHVRSARRSQWRQFVGQTHFANHRYKTEQINKTLYTQCINPFSWNNGWAHGKWDLTPCTFVCIEYICRAYFSHRFFSTISMLIFIYLNSVWKRMLKCFSEPTLRFFLCASFVQWYSGHVFFMKCIYLFAERVM